MRVLVIGSHGFIGTHLVRKLANVNHDVYQADIHGCASQRHYLIDSHAPKLRELFDIVAPDVVFNCAGAASVPLSLESPFVDFQLNTGFVAHILDALRGSASRFVNLSSAAVYGNPTHSPISEQNLTCPVSPYGVHKLMAEQLCKSYTELFNVKAMSVRIFSAYGPGLRKQLFWDLYLKGKNSKQVPLFGTGKESRDFVFIDDLVSALEAVATRAKFEGEVVNVASGASVSVAEAASTLYRCLGWDRELHFSGSTRQGDPQSWCADISSLRALGFEPACSLEAGLTKVSEWLTAQP